jgi:hypothetical protein
VLEILGTIFASVFSGGATGIIGVIAQRYADFQNKKLDMQLEAQRQVNAIALKRVESEIMAQEWAARTRVAEVETAGASDVADSQAFADSYSLEPKQYANTSTLTPGQNWLMVFLDFCRGIVRPALTVYLCVLVTLIYFMAREKLRSEDLAPEQALELFKLMLSTICYVWTTVTLWYFGTRNKQPKS